MTKPLAIVIINWNSYEVTKHTLQSLSKTNYQNYDIILVDNCSTDDSGERLKKEFSSLVFIQSKENNGFTGGNNIGLKYVLEKEYEYVLMLNSDVEVEPDFLGPLIDKLKSSDSIGAVQPLIYFYHDHELVWNAGSKYNAFLGIASTPNYNKRDVGQALRKKQNKIDWISGCAFMLKTEVLKKSGLFQPEYFMYYEDVDLSFRIKKAGYTLAYEPSSVLYHIAGHSQKSATKKSEGYISPNVHYYNIRNRIWFLKTHTKTITLPTVIIYQAISAVAISIYFIIRGRWQKWNAWNKGIIEGITTNCKINFK